MTRLSLSEVAFRRPGAKPKVKTTSVAVAAKEPAHVVISPTLAETLVTGKDEAHVIRYNADVPVRAGCGKSGDASDGGRLAHR